MQIVTTSAKEFSRASLVNSPDAQVIRPLPFDMIKTPFPDCAVAEILAISLTELGALKKNSILQPTCLQYELANVGQAYCSYWDMFSARIAMSLILWGWPSNLAVEIAFDLADEVAGILEGLDQFAVIDDHAMRNLALDVIQDSSIDFPKRASLHNLHQIVKVVSVDIFCMHQRCLMRAEV